MKIICILINYEDRSQKSELTKEPVFYLKPETSLLLNNRPFYYPEYSEEIVCDVELVLKINKVGKYISEKFASAYYDEIGLAINLTALDMRKECINNHLPWDVSASFDNSALLSRFINKSTFEDIDKISYSLKINGKTTQEHMTSALLFSFDKIVSFVSKFIMLKTGDLIFTGAIAQPLPVKINDNLEAFINDRSVLKCNIN